MIEALVASTQLAVNAALSRAALPALLFSGGKESSVLHYLVQRYTEHTKRQITHVVLHDEVQQERLAFIEQEFKRAPFPVLSFRPGGRRIVPLKAGFDLVNVYDLRGQGTFEAAVSPIPGNICLQEWLVGPMRLCPDFCFDLLLHGGRADDHHDYYGSPYAEHRLLGNIELLSPLYQWTEDDVWEAIHAYEMPYDVDRYDNGSNNHIDILKTCTECVKPGLRLECRKSGLAVYSS
jgi:3'-phosphoadenosine 5'-phosphosulfate sulfotransferase (PAPS reductase)/FAD synthetase